MRNSKSHREETVNPNLNVNGYEEHWTLKSVKMSFNNERHSYEKLAKENAYITRRSLMLHGRRKSSDLKNIYSWKSSVGSRKKQANKESRQWMFWIFAHPRHACLLTHSLDLPAWKNGKELSATQASCRCPCKSWTSTSNPFMGLSCNGMKKVKRYSHSQENLRRHAQDRNWCR